MPAAVLDTTAKALGNRVKFAEADGPTNSVVDATVLRVVPPIAVLLIVPLVIVAEPTTEPAEPDVSWFNVGISAATIALHEPAPLHHDGPDRFQR